ncbi:MAG: cell division protein FtsA [Bacteroidales bacterium]|nr:cell division protein FtsA [Bacteroidales bacterium]
MNEIITAVELATSKVSVAVGKKDGDKVTVISHQTTPITKGVRHGEVENSHKVIDALKTALDKTEENLQEPVSDVILCVSSQFLRSEACSVKKERKDPGKHITEAEFKSWQKEALDEDVEDDEVIFEAIPQAFNIDDMIGISPSEIIGMNGRKIEGFFKLIIGKKSSMQNKLDVAQRCGLNVVHTTLSSIGSARAVLNKTELENGVALLDIGAGTTDVVIVKDNIIREVSVIPFGGQSITEDIKNVACITSDMAELIKVKYGSCIEDGINENKKLILKGTAGAENTEIHLTLLASVIYARMCEIFEAALYIIEQAGYGDKIPAGIVVTGGTCYMENIKDLGRAITGHNIRLANALGNISDSSKESCFDTYSSSIVGAVVRGLDGNVSLNGESAKYAPKVTQESIKTNLFGLQDEPQAPKKPKRSGVKTTKPEQPKSTVGSMFIDLFSGKINNEV